MSRVFLNEEMRWTLEATCSECLAETIAALILGATYECSGCDATITIDPDKTVFHRKGGAGRLQEPLRRFRWGHGLFRGLPASLNRRQRK